MTSPIPTLPAIKIVIGANFGDEGKGRLTDHFVEKAKGSTVVVRANGGAQAGHTVVKQGKRTIFAHIGAGTLSGADTYLSEHFIVNPLQFYDEFNAVTETMEAKGSAFEIVVHPDALVTTPYDMLINQLCELARGENRHGSCGMGISETVIRSQNPDLRITMKDLESGNIESKLSHIRDNYVHQRLSELGVTEQNAHSGLYLCLSSEELFDSFLARVGFMLDSVNIEDYTYLSKYQNIVFEGAQGLLLDENADRFQPNTTHSTTGSKNALEVIKSLQGYSSLEVCYVTRAYMTRHGAGEFPSEGNIQEVYPDAVCETNRWNLYQRDFRYGYLDLTLLNEYISKDIELLPLNADVSLAMTCVDQLSGNPLRYYKDSPDNAYDMLFDCPVKEFLGCSKGLIDRISKAYISEAPEGCILSTETITEEDKYELGAEALWVID